MPCHRTCNWNILARPPFGIPSSLGPGSLYFSFLPSLHHKGSCRINTHLIFSWSLRRSLYFIVTMEYKNESASEVRGGSAPRWRLAVGDRHHSTEHLGVGLGQPSEASIARLERRRQKLMEGKDSYPRGVAYARGVGIPGLDADCSGGQQNASPGSRTLSAGRVYLHPGAQGPASAVDLSSFPYPHLYFSNRYTHASLMSAHSGDPPGSDMAQRHKYPGVALQESDFMNFAARSAPSQRPATRDYFF